MSSLNSNPAEPRPGWILPIIIISQFAGTSLWFAANAVLPDLQREWGLAGNSFGLITSAVQLGFILGTFGFAFFTLADRYSPRTLFFLSSLIGGLCNLGIYFLEGSLSNLLIFRLLTGICLAGIYPVGMKIASGWYREGLGNALGFLVGALVLGTSFPHLLRGIGQSVEWKTVILSISALSVIGGVLMFLLVPDGPYLSKGNGLTGNAFNLIFRSKELRSAAFSYFGHMWELYTLYAFIPALLIAYGLANHVENLNVSLWSFIIIAAGSIGCAGGGIISRRTGSATVAWVQLFVSGLCCLCSPLFFQLPVEMFLMFLIIWGMTVVGDSPQYSALIAQYAPKELVGSALTITICIGFAITIVSIEITSAVSAMIPPEYMLSILTIGPVAGLLWLTPLLRKR